MSLLETTIGWLAPAQCLGCGAEGATLCKSCATSEIAQFGERCWRCNAISQNARPCAGCRHATNSRFVWVSTVYESRAKELVQKYKFGQQRVAAQSIARLMLQTFLSFNDTQDVRQSNYLVVPVPTATSRVRQRGFDHTTLLAQIIARKLNFQFSKALRRLGQSSQVGTSRSLRLIQPTGNYFVRKPSFIQDRNILLIDDVVTTGATIKAAAQALRSAGARHVDALVFAKRL